VRSATSITHVSIQSDSLSASILTRREPPWERPLAGWGLRSRKASRSDSPKVKGSALQSQ
jgi:hypothetical protein